MIFKRRSDRALKYAKAKAKASEFRVSESAMPKFPFDSDDLHYSSIYAISSYADARLENRVDASEKLKDLGKAASFYDAASTDSKNKDFSDGFWAIAMAAYFLLGNYGSAKTSIGRIGDRAHYGTTAEVLIDLVEYLLTPGKEAPNGFASLNLFLIGEGSEEKVSKGAAKFGCVGDPVDNFFGKVIRVVVEDAMMSSSRVLLPAFSELALSEWSRYLKSAKACKILWQAQERIGRAGVFAGKNAFVQLPTGSGKTKSLELIIRSRILADACNVVAVVAPLRALCSEIASDLSSALKGVAHVHQTSDVLEIDPWIIKLTGRVTVLVFTPEKFSFTIRHEPSVLNAIDLFLFDEAHLLDSATRGPAYELLLTEIADKRPDAQKVLISAVVANPHQIAKWAFGDESSAVAGDRVQVTEKSFGLMRPNGRAIDFLNRENLLETDFFLPIDIETQDLRRGRERAPRLFPDIEGKHASAPRDFATYFADRLIPNGAVAIYLPQRQYIEPYYKRLAELVDRGCFFGSLPDSLETFELQRIQELVRLHYGENSHLAQGMLSGVLPHYSDLQGALRPSVEYALEKSYAKCVACTSTLAEGVNLPIKYLIITGVNNGTAPLKVRDFQNLIGRTARSGRFSEGSVLVVDDLSERWKQREYRVLFDPEKAENCKSAILNLINDVELPDGQVFSGAEIVRAILSALDSSALEKELTDALIEIGLNERSARSDAKARVKSLEAVESYIAGAFDVLAGEEEAEELCISTFAYSIATSDTKELLVELFKSIYLAIEQASDASSVLLCSKTQFGLRKSVMLNDAVLSEWFLAYIEGGCDDFDCLASLFLQFDGGALDKLDASRIATLCRLWIDGANLSEIADALNNQAPSKNLLSVAKVEKMVSQGLKYSMSHFVSCVIDAMENHSDLFDQQSMFPLTCLQRKLKYGVASMREVAICEDLLDDRMVARKLVGIIGADGDAGIQSMKEEMLNDSSEVQALISTMPSFCQKRFFDWLFK